MGQAFTWRDIAEQDEISRRERVELRKMELARSVSYPSQHIERSVENWKLKKQGNEREINEYMTGITGPIRRAEDPRHVVSKLERQHNLWEKRLDRKIQQSKEGRSQIKIDPKVLEMERRNAEKAERQREKAREKDFQERKAQEMKRNKEANRIKALVAAKPPAWKLTKTAEDRARLVSFPLCSKYR